MLRILLIASVLVPISAQAASTSGGLDVSVTITNLPQPIVRFDGSRFTQGAAAISVDRAGFRNVQALGQSGRNYYFSGVRQGRLYEIAVAVSNGRIVSVVAV